MRIRSLLTSVGLIASVLAVQFGFATPAMAATTLAIEGSIFDVVVDGAHDHVFVSSGPGQDSVAVLDYSGSEVTTLAIPGASGMAIVGNTLFVAAADGDEIATVDTSANPPTLGTPIDIGPFTHPESLASVAGVLWFTIGACGGTVEQAHVDTDGTNLSTAVTLNADSCPRYATSPTDANLLLMWDEGVSPMTLSEYDVSTGPPTLVTSAANPDGSSNGDDAAFAPAGASFITAAESTTAFAQVKTSDLSLIRSYTAAASPNAVDVTSTGGGRLVGGSETPAGESVWVYDIGTTTATNTFDLIGDDTVVPRGVAWADDGSVIFAVAHRSGAAGLRFYALDPAATDSMLTLSVTPGTVKVGERVTLSGTLTADDATSVEGEKVSLSRTDATGTHQLGKATVAADGSYTLKDTARVGGQATYLARFTGTLHVKPAEASDTVAVKKLASHVSIRVSDHAVTFGRSVRVTGHLGDGTQSRVLELYAKPDGGNKKLIRRARVDRHGNLSASFSPSRDTTFIAHFDGDPKHRSADDRAATRVRLIVHAKLTRFVSTSGKYKIYRRGANAPVVVHVSPNHAGYRVTATLQGFVNGGWNTFDTVSAPLNSRSNVKFFAHGSSNVNFRAQVRLPTHKDHLGDASPWLYFRFK